MSKVFKCALVVLLVAMGVSCQRPRETPSPTPLRRLDSLLYSELNEHQRWVIVQVEPRTQTSHLWIDELDVCCPSRSPDGRRVAYLERGKELESWSLWIADFDGQNAVHISKPYSFKATPRNIEWSFDSQYIAFCAREDADAARYIYVLDATKGQEILSVPGWDSAWSKAANRFVVYGGASAYNLKIVDIPNGIVRRLPDVNIPNFYDALDWTLDGRTVIFPSVSGPNQYSLQTIYAIDADGSNLRELTRDTAQLITRDIGDVHLSPDGKFLLFRSRFNTKEGTGDEGLMVMDLGSGKVRKLASSTTGPVAWSPDSKYVTFGGMKDQQGNKIRSFELFMVALESGTITRLTHNEAAPEGLTW